jgi:DinB superfamily
MPNPVDRDIPADLRFPVGRYQPVPEISAEMREAWICELEALPRNLRNAVAGLSETQLDTPYRPGGWTVRQVVHHLPDSHMNSYCRFRLALTESSPSIKTYEEALWAELPDARTSPIEPSLVLLEGLHLRLTAMLRSMVETDFSRTFSHPELGEIRLDWTLGLYAWHSRHHVAHITNVRSREGW